MKLLRNLGIGLFVLLLIAVVAAYVGIPGAIRSGTEKVSKSAMEVDTNVSAAAVDYSGGTVSLDRYVAHNPAGFSQPDFLAIEKISVTAGVRDLMADPAQVADVLIDKPVLTIEQAATGSNLSKIQEALAKQKGSRWSIQHLKIAGGKVHFVLPLANQDTTIDVPEIDLKNLTNKDGGPAMMGDVLHQVISAMVQQTIDKGGLPLDLRNQFAQGIGLDSIGRIKDTINDVGNKVKGALDGIFGKGDKDKK